MNTAHDLTDFYGPPIHVYTRANAIDDGVLVDVSEAARKAGIRFPVALTIGAYAACVTWSGDNSQDESGRLWDVVCLLARAIRAASGADLTFAVMAVPNKRGAWCPVRVDLAAVCGPGDDADPVITVGLPGED